MLIKREKTTEGLPMISFFQRAPYWGQPNLILGEERPEHLQIESDLPGVLFVKQPVWTAMHRSDDGTLVLRRFCTQREQEDQDLAADGQSWPLAAIDDFILQSQQVDFAGQLVPVQLILVQLGGASAVMACHTGEPIEGMQQLQDELRQAYLPLRAGETAARRDAPRQPTPVHGVPEPELPAAEVGFPRPIGRPSGRMSWQIVVTGVIAAGLLIAVLAFLLRGRDETLDKKRFDEAITLGNHMAQVSATIGDAIADVLRPYCPENGCRRARVAEGAFQAWDYVATPAGLRVLLTPYLEPDTHAPMARVRIDAATLRSDGDLTEGFPAIGEMVDRLLQKLQFPGAYRNGCTGPQIIGVNSFTCATGPYDPVFGAFDSRDWPTVRLFKTQKSYTLTSRGPWRYEGSNGKALRYGP